MLQTALAEATQASQNELTQWDINMTLSICIIAYLLIYGVAGFRTGKLYGWGRMVKRYTPASQAEFGHLNGLCMMAAGIGGALAAVFINRFSLNPLWLYAGLAVMVASIAADFVLFKKTMIRK